MKNIVLKSGKFYSIKDFNLDAIVKNEDLLSELDMATLPETLHRVLGVYPEHLYLPILSKKIDMYDKSDEVNSFIYRGNKYWLDKQQRSCMRTVAESGLQEIEVVMGDHTVTLPSEFVKQFILNLEAYAYKCYVITAKHKQNIKSLINPKDIINYDYTTGYPDKIVLE
jgi:hypothetical protein